MTTPFAASPLFRDPRRLLLDMAREHQLPDLLRLVVDRLTDSPRVALARIWLVQSSEGCTGCPMPAECRGRSACLHLVASSGRSVVDPRDEWTRLNGAFSRFPMGSRKVGQIAATGEALEIPDLSPAPPDWVARPEWIHAEGIAGFGGQPLIHRGEVLGVLAVFARGAVGPECMDWLRTIADHTAAAIATARAFEQIEQLRAKLEMENEYLREEVTRTGAFGELIGQGPALAAVARQIDLVAATDAAVLILGESGTARSLSHGSCTVGASALPGRSSR
jgi:GAF domain-containing protein